MPTNVYKRPCLTCGHPVNPDAKNVGVIKMSNQPRYYHLDHSGCQEAESRGWLVDEDTYQQWKVERAEMVVME